MTRTTITISEETLDLYRRVAHEKGVSMATLMREVLEGKSTIARPKPRAGLGASGHQNLSIRSAEEGMELPDWHS
jgi:hypothetical protein